MKLAVAAVVAITLCLGSLAARSLVVAHLAPALPGPEAAAAQNPVDTIALASIDRHLHRKLARLARGR